MTPFYNCYFPNTATLFLPEMVVIQRHSIGPYNAMTFLSLNCIADKSLSFVVIYRMYWRQFYFLLLIFDILDLNHSVSALLSIFIIIGSYLDG